LLVALEEFQLTLKVMAGVLMLTVTSTVTMDQTGITFQVLLVISVLVLIMMFGVLIGQVTFLTLLITNGIKCLVVLLVLVSVTLITFGELIQKKISGNGPLLAKDKLLTITFMLHLQ